MKLTTSSISFHNHLRPTHTRSIRLSASLDRSVKLTRASTQNIDLYLYNYKPLITTSHNPPSPDDMASSHLLTLLQRRTIPSTARILARHSRITNNKAGGYGRVAAFSTGSVRRSEHAEETFEEFTVRYVSFVVCASAWIREGIFCCVIIRRSFPTDNCFTIDTKRNSMASRMFLTSK